LLVNLYLTIQISSYLIPDIQTHSFEKYYWLILIYLFSYYWHKLLTRRMVTTNEFTIILKANFVTLVGIFFIISAVHVSDSISRMVIFIYFILNSFNSIWSYLIKKYFFKLNIFRKPIFAICDEQGETNIKSWFSKGNPFGYDVELILNVNEYSSLEMHKEIDKIIKENKYDSAIIDFDSNNIFELSDLVDHIQRNIYKIIILPKISKMPLLNGELINSIHHKGMAFYVRNNLLSPVDKYMKNIFDYLTALSLILIFSPLLILLYLIVYFSTNGHPLFKHRRIGLNGKKFNVYKFRTMYIDADKKLEELLEENEESRIEWENDFKLKDDPRITKIGTFLRKTSLDELPQLINVLQGKMSLIGPRPIIDQEIVKYGEYFDYFTAVKPGITGLWQVSGRNDIDYDERVQLDVWYVRNWSINLDIQILLKTVLVVIGRKGSY
jgi:undecaprenyl-phosphate galactose phosphotransferase